MDITKISNEIERQEAKELISIGDGEISLLRGGIHLLWGKSLSGKTSLSLLFSKKALENGFNVFYADTEGSWHGHAQGKVGHIDGIAEAEKEGGNIWLTQEIPEPEDYLDWIDDLGEEVRNRDIDLLVIDSLILPVIDLHPQKVSSKFRSILKRLKKIAVSNDAAIIVTTHAVSETDNNLIEDKEIVKPRGGNAISHGTDSKIFIENPGTANTEKTSGSDPQKRIIWDANWHTSILAEIVPGKEIIKV